MNTLLMPLREAEPIGPPPPANVEAEQALLGAILINNSAYSRVAEFLRRGAFLLSGPWSNL